MTIQHYWRQVAIQNLQEWVVGKSLARRALGANIEMDGRVSESREAFFWDSQVDPSSDIEQPSDLDDMLRQFAEDQLNAGRFPDFLRLHNRDNRQNRILDTGPLVNIYKIRLPIDPSAASIPVKIADAELSRLFPRGTTHVSHPQPLADAQSNFLEDYFSKSAQKHQPVWAGLWSQFEAILPLGPSFWQSAFGIRNPATPRLCVVLKYQSDVLNKMPLYRPTILDADRYDAHFPSPPEPCQSRIQRELTGGHPMSLHAATRVTPLLEEFIHVDFPRTPEMVVSWGWTDPTFAETDLASARIAHLRQLDHEYTQIRSWCPEPI